MRAANEISSNLAWNLRAPGQALRARAVLDVRRAGLVLLASVGDLTSESGVLTGDQAWFEQAHRDGHDSMDVGPGPCPQAWGRHGG
jgi:hypothetical protein